YLVVSGVMIAVVSDASSKAGPLTSFSDGMVSDITLSANGTVFSGAGFVNVFSSAGGTLPESPLKIYIPPAITGMRNNSNHHALLLFSGGVPEYFNVAPEYAVALFSLKGSLVSFLFADVPRSSSCSGSC